MKNKIQVSSFIIIIFAVYIVLLKLLVIFEAGSGSAIQDMGDAFWYMLVTVTTTGYGDIIPATFPGRVIGVIFLLSSAGILLLFIKLIFSWLSGSLVPEIAMFIKRKEEWYIFFGSASFAEVLAGSIRRDDKKALLIFQKGAEDDREVLSGLRSKGLIVADDAIDELADKHRGDGPCHVFLLCEDGWKNYEKLEELKDKRNLSIYCKTEYLSDVSEKGRVIFNPREIIARHYWLTYPIKKGEHSVVLIGNGRYAEKLIEKAILINVLPEGNRIEYHLFGDQTHFKDIHPELSHSVSFNVESSDTDTLFFHEDSWPNRPDIIKNADRIIICDEEQSENLRIFIDLQSYFACRGEKYILHSHKVAGAVTFGITDQLYQKGIIVNQGLNMLAFNMNKIYMKRFNGVDWSELSPFFRQSNIAAADHLLTKIRLLLPDEDVVRITSDICRRAYEQFIDSTPEQREEYRKLEHERWMRFYRMFNWTYAPERNNSLRQHNLLVPYEKLSREEQLKDDSAWEILNDALF